MFDSKFKKILYIFITVFITVHAFVFYSLYVVNGSTLMSLTNTTSVLKAIEVQGGVYAFGQLLPIWLIIVIEFCFAFVLELFIGSKLSLKITLKKFNPKETNPNIIETSIICVTVVVMCSLMSLIASFMYYPYYTGFNIISLLANYIKLICLNLPFAFFSQLFFIQPFMRYLFCKIK